MYELSVALRYLYPRWRQLSSALIALLSIAVIALIVWLVVVFFSVTRGLEKSWTQKLLAVTAPVRVIPTQEYYRSYYHLIDGVSLASDFTTKSLTEKWHTDLSDPYDPASDEELPTDWPEPFLNDDGSLKDLVKELFSIIDRVKGDQILHVAEYQIASADIELFLHRPQPSEEGSMPLLSPSTINQQLFITNFDAKNPSLSYAAQPLSEGELCRFASRCGRQKQQEAIKEFVSSDSLAFLKEKQAVRWQLNEAMPFENQIALLRALYPEKAPVLLPKAFADAGACFGDVALLHYHLPTATAMQRGQSECIIAGFYDPGILPLGGKFALADPDLVSSLKASQELAFNDLNSGLSVHLKSPNAALQVEQKLNQAFKEAALDRFFKVETFHNYPLASDFIQQLHSERNLFSLVASIVILIACSNILSMLIILVNDKKQEVGILKAMGASSKSIALIFGLCGVTLGTIGSVLGIAFALLTLAYIDELVAFLGHLQGHQLLNPLFYGTSLPNEVSGSAMFFVVATTAFISLLAGIVPALKACWMKPSALLKGQ